MAAPARIDELRHQYAAHPRRYLAPLANALRRAGALEEAVTMLRAQLAEYPDHLTGHVVLGQALFDTGALAESQTAFEAARALDPGNRVVLHHLGEIASLAGDAAGARTWFSRLRAADPYADDIAAQLGGIAAPPAPYQDEPAEAEAPPVDAAREVAPSVLAAPNVAEHVAERVAHAADDTPPLAAEPFELLDFGATVTEVEHASGPGEPTLDPVVGLDLALAEVPPELDAVAEVAPAGDITSEHDANAADALEHLTAGPFATETMAGLLAAQGHTEQAIAIYERLTAERPDDAGLRTRLDALRDTAPAGVGDAHTPEEAHTPHPVDVSESAHAEPASAGDGARGALLAAAFAGVPARVAADRARAVVGGTPGAALDVAPTPAAEPDPFADVSFDRFFPDTAAEAPNENPAVDGDADLARFDAWLRGASGDAPRVTHP